MARIDNINERRARQQNATLPAQAPPALSPAPVGGNPASTASEGTPIDQAPRPDINPASLTNESYRRVALQQMDEEAFNRNKEQMNASDKEYWAEQAKLNPLNTYANLQSYLASEETPEEQRRRERREQLGQTFANLGNLIGNAANLYYTAQGAVPVDLNRGMMAENERMRRIKEKRDAAKEKQDILLANARSADIKNLYDLRARQAKAAADAAEKEKDRELGLDKLKLQLDYDRQRDDANRAVNEKRIAEQERHNRALEASASAGNNKVLDSAVGADGNIYTRNTKMTENEAMQIVQSTGLGGEELEPFITRKYDYLGNVTSEEVDWMAAAAYALQKGDVNPEELKSRGFKLGGKREPEDRYSQYIERDTDYNQYKRK